MISPLIAKLQDVAVQYGQNKALIDKKNTVTFAELRDLTERMAGWLAQKGIKKGDRVLVYIPMSIPLYCLLLAIWQIGAIAVFVDAWTTKKRLLQVQEIAECTAFIGSIKAHSLRLLKPQAFRSIKRALFLPSLNTIHRSLPFDCVDVDAETTALITFTTGSTGIPKGADRSHAFLMAQNEVLSKHMNLQPGTTDLTTLPIIVLNNLASGVTSVIPSFPFTRPEKLKAARLVEYIRKYNIESSASSPYVFECLAEYLEKMQSQEIQLKKIFIGGAAVFPQLIQKLQAVFPEAVVEIVYGSTEAEPISTCIPGKLIQKINDVLHSGLLVGKPVDDISLRIIDYEKAISAQMSAEEFDAVSKNRGLPGEICVAGHHVLQKYYRDEAANKENKINVQGVIWHRTGDAGYLDKDNNLFLLGRVRQGFEIQDQTYYVFPFEGCLAANPYISAGTVLKMNEQVYVLIELLNRSYRQQALKEIDLLKLPFPYTILFIKLPRDPRHNSKIDYDRLKESIKGNKDV